MPDDSLKGQVEKATSPLKEEVQFSYFFFLWSKYMVDSMLVLYCIADPNFKCMHKITVVMISLKAHEVMSVDIEAATQNASAIEVATRTVLGDFNGMPVIDGNGHPVGQITAIDILKAMRNGKDINNTIVK